MAGSFLVDAIVYLGTALVFVPISKKLKIGSVLGYIIGGIIVGPFVLHLIGREGQDVMHSAEFGVVMMLFLIGLELQPQTFWKMRKLVLGLGGFQMVVTGLALFPLLYFVFGLSLSASTALSMILPMSSTAIVLQTLKEKSLDQTLAGKSSFSVLLFQDIAVIPILALLPLLAVNGMGNAAGESGPEFLGVLNDYPTVLLILAVALVFIISRFIVNPVLHFIAKTHTRELFTAFALFLVIGISYIMELAGISAALGAFLSGVLLANSEFRHELESDIEPFKGLLLGVFFIAVGSTINFEVIQRDWMHVLLGLVLVVLVKWLVLYFLARVFGLVSDQKILFAFLLSQVGEFAFVLLGSSMQAGILTAAETDLFTAIVTLSMIISPLLLFLNERLILPHIGVKESVVEKESDVVNENKKVILIGFGHFGNSIGRFLRANKVEATIIDNDSDRVTLLRKMGFKVYYGDGTRLDILEAAGVNQATALLSAIDDPDRNLELAELGKKHFPKVKLFIRAKNRYDAYELMDKGVDSVYRESLHDSVFMGVDVLAFLGQRRYTLYRKAQDFIRYDQNALGKLSTQRHDESGYINSVRAEIELQEKLLREDQKFNESQVDNSWDSANR